MRSNCLIVAWVLYQRRRAKGREGYLMLRASRLGPYVHLLYAERRASGSLRVVSFKPADTGYQMRPPLLFRGAVRWGDAP